MRSSCASVSYSGEEKGLSGLVKRAITASCRYHLIFEISKYSLYIFVGVIEKPKKYGNEFFEASPREPNEARAEFGVKGGPCAS